MENTYEQLLADLTGTRPEEWKIHDGPDSGMGVDYYFRHPRCGVVFINYDQGSRLIKADPAIFQI